MPRYSPSRSPRRSRSRSRDRYQSKDDYSERHRADSRERYGASNGDRHRGERDDRNNDRYRDRSYERRSEDMDQCRIHIADLTDSVTQYDIEKAFMKFGEIREVWMAKNPPCFAFVVFKGKQDAAQAVKEMDQKYN